MKTWNRTPTPFAINLCIHELFEDQVEKTPDNIAVLHSSLISGGDGDKQLTYQELNERANQVAHFLRERGVGPEILVGICVERSLEMVVGLLGILKAGGVYVPIDPTFPMERILYILDDTKAQILLTHDELVLDFSQYTGEVFTLDGDIEASTKFSYENPINLTKTGNLAYVIYTSGSTGKPKGVQVTHNSVTNFFNSLEIRPGISENDTMVSVTTFSFDISVLELFLPLINGGKVVLVDHETASNGYHLIEILDKYEATMMQATPATWQMLLMAGWQGKPELHIISGGETLPPQLATELLYKGIDLWNMYGPTETTIYSSIYSVTTGETGVPIGYPIHNTQIYILDIDFIPAPIGVTGELYIGGKGLARGYLNRPDQTAEVFIPNPFSEMPGERLYKTGDLARCQQDGNIEFLGRVDNQVKIRGFRIELGEIEAVANQYPGVKNTVVTTHGDSIKNKKLVAYIISKEEVTIAIDDLREHIRNYLPSYMVPSIYMVIDELPLTPIGKINRRALPEPDPKREELEITYITSRTPTEEIIAGIWSEVLGLEKIEVNDNFFELGGHSLSATQVITRVRKAFQVEIELKKIFDTPTIAGMAGQISGLSETQIPPLKPTSRGGFLPLSFAQQRLWFLDQLAPGMLAYNICNAVRLKGTLNIRVFEQSIMEVVRRHEALRTVFPVMNERPEQKILPVSDIRISQIDLQQLPENEREENFLKQANEEVHRSFDLEKGPLFRSFLFTIKEGEHILLLVIHHIVTDGWSFGVFFDELGDLYQAFLHDNESPLLELPIQFPDYAKWQRGLLNDDVLETQLTYWSNKLSGADLLELPTDRVRPPTQSFLGKSHISVLSIEIIEKLKVLSRKVNATLYMTLLTAFNVLLYRYSNQEDILVGTPLAGRDLPEVEGLIGYFLKTIVVRNDLSGDPTFLEMIDRVRDIVVEAHTYQDLPFEKLVDALDITRDLSRNPLFQVMFTLQNYPLSSRQLTGLEMSSVHIERKKAMYDLTLTVEEGKQGLQAIFEYCTDLFDDETITRMADHFNTMLEAIVMDPGQRISKLSLITAKEEQQVLVDWNSTQAEFPDSLTIPQLFAQQVARTPKATAFILGSQSLSYKELDQRSNQVAHYLRSFGVGPDTIVGVCMERSLEMPGVLMGVFKAGGCYLPLDPTYPQERLNYLLKDANVDVLVTFSELKYLFPKYHGQIVILDEDRERITSQSSEKPVCSATPDNLIYVTYTSGTTGKPKGVAVPIRQIINNLHYKWETFPFSDDEVYCQRTTFGFVDSCLEMLEGLLKGIPTVIIPDEIVKDPYQFVQVISDYQVTRVRMVPSLLKIILDTQNDLSKLLSKLKIWFISGEALPLSVAHRFREVLPESILVNIYGLSEVLGVSCYQASDEKLDAINLTIGGPITNRQIYILDSNLQPLPIGVPGELYAGGNELARGYLNHVDLTAEKFIPNPFSREPGSRLFKSGDWARYLPDGKIDYIGRIDNQVKIRGFRIELGEIETVTKQHPGVNDVVVITQGDSFEGKKLVAYIVPELEAIPTIDELRNHIRNHLPEYMMPSSFMVIDSLPLTPTGKIDRRALPALDPMLLEKKYAYTAPRTPAEEIVAGMWAEVLGLEKVGVTDNFFELGGHSLSATRVISRVRNAFQVDLSLKNFFEKPTIVNLVSEIQNIKDVGLIAEKILTSHDSDKIK